MSEDTVSTGCGKQVRVLGHMLYVRKCIEPDIIDKATGKLLLALPDWAKDFAEKAYAWVELIGKGPQVGAPAEGQYLQQREAKHLPRHVPDEYMIGDMLLIPAEPWRFYHSPYAESGERGIEFFIDETVPLAISRGESA
jgi:hypothetical protein